MILMKRAWSLILLGVFIVVLFMQSGYADTSLFIIEYKSGSSGSVTIPDQFVLPASLDEVAPETMTYDYTMNENSVYDCYWNGVSDQWELKICYLDRYLDVK